MADPKKVRWSQLKVGIVGLVAFLILVVLIFLLTSSRGFFQKTAILYTYMDDASGMAEGTPVRLNGFTIGSLEKIQLTTSTDPKKTRGVRDEGAGEIPAADPGGFGGGHQRRQPAGRQVHQHHQGARLADA